MSERMAIDVSLIEEINGIATEVRRSCGNCRWGYELGIRVHKVLTCRETGLFIAVNRDDVCDGWRQNERGDDDNH